MSEALEGNYMGFSSFWGFHAISSSSSRPAVSPVLERNASTRDVGVPQFSQRILKSHFLVRALLNSSRTLFLWTFTTKEVETGQWPSLGSWVWWRPTCPSLPSWANPSTVHTSSRPVLISQGCLSSHRLQGWAVIWKQKSGQCHSPWTHCV